MRWATRETGVESAAQLSLVDYDAGKVKNLSAVN
jgi:hypothetical protein